MTDQVISGDGRGSWNRCANGHIYAIGTFRWKKGYKQCLTCGREQSQKPREKETKIIMTINILLWIAAGMAVWAALIIAIILFFMGTHVTASEDEK